MQFDVYENPNEDTARFIPFLVDLQADILSGLHSRVVAPLVIRLPSVPAAKNLNPQFVIRERSVFLSTAEITGIPIGALGRKVGNLSNKRSEIISALDFLFTGF